MLAKTHVAFAFLLSLFIIPFIDYNPYIFTAVLVFSALLPDIDTSKSKLGMKIKPISWLLNKLFGHRGLFHTVYFALALFFLFFYLNLRFIGFAVLIGYLSHILLDGFTKEGVRIFHPLSNYHVKGFMNSGGFLESLIFIGLLFGSFMKLFF